jgi:hypothetical protein
LVRQFLAFQEEVQSLALSAADGTVIDVCENAVLEQGRDLHTRVLAEAVARRIEAAEKKGRRSAVANAVSPRKTGAGRRGSS